MVPQGTTERILRERLRTFGPQVEFGTRLVDFAQNEHAVDATLSTGPTLRARYLIGCDGAHSTVRKALGLRLEGEVIEDKPKLVADIEVEGLDRGSWHVWPFSNLVLSGFARARATSTGKNAAISLHCCRTSNSVGFLGALPLTGLLLVPSGFVCGPPQPRRTDPVRSTAVRMAAGRIFFPPFFYGCSTGGYTPARLVAHRAADRRLG